MEAYKSTTSQGMMRFVLCGNSNDQVRKVCEKALKGSKVYTRMDEVSSVTRCISQRPWGVFMGEKFKMVETTGAPS